MKDILGRRNWFFLLSLVIIVPGIISMATQGFRLGIAFAGGDRITVHYKNGVTPADIQKEIDTFKVDAIVQDATNQRVIITTKPLSSTAAPGQTAQDKQIRDDLNAKFGPPAGGGDAVETFDTVGPQIASQLVITAAILVGISALFIVIYLAFRFSVPGVGRWKFAVSAIIALLHDVFILTGIFSILGKVFNLAIGEIDTLFVTAVLTVVGFSVHDTIVIFDRIRENLRFGGAQRLLKQNFESVVNLSIVQSLARSVNTSMTVVFTLLALLLIAPTSIKGFALALLIGIVSGTYSSIFNASPLLVAWRDWETSGR
ncbi:MAG: preprotein translocase subunit SecF [Chloroflexota bacterium]|jgi:preprotein translocase subunit SecF|nr:preprotein translocase subunit SecF [Chloroflexota bacterium]